MLKFKRTTLPTNPKNSICVEVEGKDTWYECSAEVKSYAQQNFKSGEQCEVTKENRDGKEFVTKIFRPGQGGAAVASSPASTPAAQAQQAQKQAEPKSTGYAKSPEDSKQIRRLSVLSSAANALTGIQSQLDPNTLPEYLVALYNRLLAEVEK